MGLVMNFKVETHTLALKVAHITTSKVGGSKMAHLRVGLPFPCTEYTILPCKGWSNKRWFLIDNLTLKFIIVLNLCAIFNHDEVFGVEIGTNFIL